MAGLKYRVDREDVNEHGQVLGFAEWMGGPTLARVKNAVCHDGKQRTAFVTGNPLTYFSLPARVNIGKSSVKGSLAVCEDGLYTFHPFAH